MAAIHEYAEWVVDDVPSHYRELLQFDEVASAAQRTRYFSKTKPTQHGTIGVRRMVKMHRVLYGERCTHTQGGSHAAEHALTNSRNMSSKWGARDVDDYPNNVTPWALMSKSNPIMAVLKLQRSLSGSVSSRQGTLAPLTSHMARPLGQSKPRGALIPMGLPRTYHPLLERRPDTGSPGDITLTRIRYNRGG